MPLVSSTTLSVAFGAILIGVVSSWLGSFMVVRRMALVGDAISHAVLPGIMIAFLLTFEKDPAVLLSGALLTGLAGYGLMALIARESRLKEEAALGIVLSSFFAMGILLLTIIQTIPVGTKGGLDKFLFGQVVGITPTELLLMGLVALVALAIGITLYKEYLILSFDPVFARCAGVPTRALDWIFMVLVGATIVVSVRLVGVILVSAMLITPAATGFLLSDRMPAMIAWASGAGVMSALIGVAISASGERLPAGPMIVLAAASLFAIAWLFSPRHGVISLLIRRFELVRKTDLENTVKAIASGCAEGKGFVSLSTVARELGEPVRVVMGRVRRAVRGGLAELDSGIDGVRLTETGERLAKSVLRRHRLWELYLSRELAIPPDHVHANAETIEHRLAEPIVQAIDKALEYPTSDPHGRPIPKGDERGE